MELKKQLEEIKDSTETEKEKQIDSVNSQYKQVKEQYNQLLDKVNKCLYYLNKKGKNKITEKDRKDVLGLTCWNHLAFCCSNKKACFFRDTVLEVLDIDKEELENEKKKKVNEIIRKNKK